MGLRRLREAMPVTHRESLKLALLRCVTMRLFVILLLIALVAGCTTVGPAPPKAVTRGAHIAVENRGRTPVDATMTWRTSGGAQVRQETARLFPGDRIDQHSLPPVVALDSHVAIIVDSFTTKSQLRER